MKYKILLLLSLIPACLFSQKVKKDIYSGDTKDGLKNGYGVMLYTNKSTYSGEWKDDLYNGKGKRTYLLYSNNKLVDQGYYDGYWINGKKEGQGVQLYYRGSKYEGEWVQDAWNGKGIYNGENSITISEGEFKNGSLSGVGKFTDNLDSFYYEGEFKQGMFNGNGKLTRFGKFKESIEGEWIEGKIKLNSTTILSTQYGIFKGLLNQGFIDVLLSNLKFWSWSINLSGNGEFNFNNGDKIIGKIPGGKVIYNNGDVYEGDCEWTRKDGFGKLTYNNGDIYEGEWFNDMKYGKFKIIYKNGDVFEGKYFEDKKNGNGKITYKNGDTFECTWIDDKKSGRGTYNKSGSVPGTKTTSTTHWHDDIEIHLPAR